MFLPALRALFHCSWHDRDRRELGLFSRRERRNRRPLCASWTRRFAQRGSPSADSWGPLGQWQWQFTSRGRVSAVVLDSHVSSSLFTKPDAAERFSMVDSHVREQSHRARARRSARRPGLSGPWPSGKGNAEELSSSGETETKPRPVLLKPAQEATVSGNKARKTAPTHDLEKMPKCDACRGDGAKLRCHKCQVCVSVLPFCRSLLYVTTQGCWSCDKACAKRFWRTHKKFCTEDPTLKPHVPIELAFERVLAKAPKMTEPPPENATCYICLEVAGPNGDNVTRACACRGPSAGFAHVDCLAEMAARSPWIVISGKMRLNRWNYCTTCHSTYVGALAIEMSRRWWRRTRNDPPSDARYPELARMAMDLRQYGEVDAADRLDKESMRGLAHSNPVARLRSELMRAHNLMAAHRYHEALEILTRVRPSMEHQNVPSLRSVYARMVATSLAKVGRCHEALPFAVEAVERAAEAAGPESQEALYSVNIHAQILARLGQVGEAKAKLERLLVTQTRVLGATHHNTLETKSLLDAVSWTAARAVERP